MEVYSIINDLDHIPIKTQATLTQQAFIRNKYLLKQYSIGFKSINEVDFRRKLRSIGKQIRSVKKNSIKLRFSTKDLRSVGNNIKQNNFCPTQARIIPKLKLDTCINIPRLSVLKNFENTQRLRRTQKQFVKRIKRQSVEFESCKIKKVSLGQNLQISDQKIQTFLKTRYKSILTRLKNWYQGPQSNYKFSNRSTNFINQSLTDYINKNFRKQSEINQMTN